MIKELEKKGHEILVTARDKEVTVNLLEAYDIEYTILSSMKQGKANLIKEWIVRDYKLLNIARKFKPDVLTGILNPCVAHVSWLLGKKSIVFNDTEHATFAQKITYPFSSMICTPSSFKNDIGKKQLKYDGYHELAYLHPNNFTPNSEVLNELGIEEGDTFIVLRFVSWGASHDIGHNGIQNKMELINNLEQFGRVLITSEGKLEPELEDYKIKISPEKLHDLLYYSSLYIGDGGTTAVEAAILGTPSIYVSSLVGTMGNFSELEDKYELMLNYSDSKAALDKAIKLIRNPSSKNKWNEKRNQLLKEKIDVTSFMVDFISNYY
jgi:predicted glycosyltransferase